MLQATVSWPLDAEQQSLLAHLLHHTISLSDANGQNEDNQTLIVEAPDVCPSPPELALVLPRGNGPPSFIGAISNARKMEVYTQDGEYCGTGEAVAEPNQDDKEFVFSHALHFDDDLKPSSSSYTLKFLLPKDSRNRFLLAAVDIVAPPTTDHAQSARPSLSSLAGGARGLDMTSVRKMLASIDLPLSPAAMQLLANVETQQQQQQQQGSSSGLLGAGAAGNPIVSIVLDANARLQQIDNKIDDLKRYFDARFDKLENALANLVEILSQDQD
ncbi:hypothetical protein BDZ88DRAFT_169388 [Geranomyces variabilis]|nr:hypothetical protein BDZ88DRAFT_169388 [Geranomyces variabilis]KAJ3135093.1 hypothetical protein HDU90_004124 [Geranomyces variabilis]